MWPHRERGAKESFFAPRSHPKIKSIERIEMKVPDKKAYKFALAYAEGICVAIGFNSVGSIEVFARDFSCHSVRQGWKNYEEYIEGYHHQYKENCHQFMDLVGSGV